MKHLTFLQFLALGVCFATTARAQTNIAVVDMKMAYDNYFKTKQEVSVINEKASEEFKNIDARKADYQQIVSKMIELDKKVRSTEFSQEKRLAAKDELEKLTVDQAAKAAEIEAAERRANTKLFTMRAEMEAKLLGEIRDTSAAVAKAKGYDLVLDKSFLPNANKMIVHVSPNVPDITAEVVARINDNASAPAP